MLATTRPTPSPCPAWTSTGDAGSSSRSGTAADRTKSVIEHVFATAKQGLFRRLGREMEDQTAQAALAANLRHPDEVRILCGTLDQLPRAFAELDCQKVTGPTPLPRNNRNAALRCRNRARADDAKQRPPPNPPRHPIMRPELQLSNRILTR